MPPYVILSPDLSSSYKFFEGPIFRLLESAGVDVNSLDNRKQILDGLVDFDRLYDFQASRPRGSNRTFVEADGLSEPDASPDQSGFGIDLGNCAVNGHTGRVRP